MTPTTFNPGYPVPNVPASKDPLKGPATEGMPIFNEIPGHKDTAQQTGDK